MTDHDRLLALVDGDPIGRQADPPTPRTRLERVCVVSVSEVGVDGAGVTVMGSLERALEGARDQLAASGELTRLLEDLQLTTGEGPCLDAYRDGRPVLAGDLDAESARWPGFGPEAVRAGAAAVFSLPLQVGAARLGTLDLHRRTPGPLATASLAAALTLATMATETVVELAGDTDPATVSPAGWLPDVHADVHVATGMVAALHGVDTATALLRLRGHAFGHDQSLHAVARRIIDRDLVLDQQDPPADCPPPDLETDP